MPVHMEEVDEDTLAMVSDSVGRSIVSQTYMDKTPLGRILATSSACILTHFRTRALQSYKKDEFFDQVPEELRALVDRDPAIIPGDEMEYHEARVNYLKRVMEHIEKEPALLRNYEQFMLKFFMGNLIYNSNNLSRNTHANAALQAEVLESNISNMYTMLSIRKLGLERYITGIEDTGEVYSKKARKLNLEQAINHFSRVASHAPVLLSLDSKLFQDLIPDGAEWAHDYKRLEDFLDENNGKVGFEMLRVGQENKHYHSSLPHQVIIKDKSIKYMTVKDDPPKNIYFMTTFSDDTISVGVMSSKYDDNGACLYFTSDLLSNFFLNSSIDRSSFFLFDLAGCIARDMFVCVEKDKFYGGSRVISKKKKKDIRERVIWLPRFKINLINKPDYTDIGDKIIKLSPYHVDGHPRKLPQGQKPSQKQLDLAKKFGVPIPEGKTYVDQYDVPGKDEFRRLYKSRSALNLLYGNL